MISATDNPFSRSISLFSSTKSQPIFSGEYFAQRGLARAAQPDQRDAGKRRPPRRRRVAAGKQILGPRDLARGGFPKQVADDLPVRGRFGCRNKVLEMRAHRVRYASEQHDGDVAFAAFKLGDVALGNAGNLGEHLARHAAKRPRGADALAELFEKTGFRILVMIPAVGRECGRVRKHNAGKH